MRQTMRWLQESSRGRNRRCGSFSLLCAVTTCLVLCLAQEATGSAQQPQRRRTSSASALKRIPSSKLSQAHHHQTTSRRTAEAEEAEPSLYLYDDNSKPVIEIKSSKVSFEKAPSLKPRVVVFYSPSCPACIRFQSQYVAFAKAVQEKHGKNGVSLYAVSCEAHADLCQKYDIDGYPSVRVTLDNGRQWTTLDTPFGSGPATAFLLRQLDPLLAKGDEPVAVSSSSANRRPVQSDAADKPVAAVKSSSSSSLAGLNKKRVDASALRKRKASSSSALSAASAQSRHLGVAGDDEDEGEAEGEDEDEDDGDDVEGDEDEEVEGGEEDGDELDEEAEGAGEEREDDEQREAEEVEEEDIEALEDEEEAENEDEEADEDENEESEEAEKAEEEEEENMEEEEEGEREAQEEEEEEGEEDSESDGLGVADENMDQEAEGSDEDDEDEEEDEFNVGEREEEEDDEEFDGGAQGSEEEDEDEEEDNGEDRWNRWGGDEEEGEGEYNRDDVEEYQDYEDEDEEEDGAFPNFEQRPLSPSERSGAARARLVHGPRAELQSVQAIYRQQLQEARNRKRFAPPGWLRNNNNRKPNSRRHQFQYHDAQMPVQQRGATDSMLAHQPFGAKYYDRRAAILQTIEAKRGKKVRRKVEERWNAIHRAQGRLKLPFTKQVSKPRLVERVPVLQRVVVARLLPEEELMLDTSLSLLHGLRHGVYKDTPRHSPLPAEKRRVLRDWLELLSVTLPEEWGLHDVLDDLLQNMKEITQSESKFLDALQRHPMRRKQWSASCTIKGAAIGGFACGFWKLLHTASVGLAQHRGGKTLVESGMRRADTRTFSPAELAQTVADYMQHFYPCPECSSHFATMYNDCDNNRRCDRLAAQSTDATIDDDDWKEAAKWLWEVHNDVSVRVAQERASKAQARKSLLAGPAGAPSATTTIAALWPRLDDCVKCFAEDGSWQEDAVFLYLEAVYWPDDLVGGRSASRMLQFEEGYESSANQGLFYVLVVLSVGLLYMLHQNRRALQQTILTVKKSAAAATAQASGTTSVAVTKKE